MLVFPKKGGKIRIQERGRSRYIFFDMGDSLRSTEQNRDYEPRLEDFVHNVNNLKNMIGKSDEQKKQDMFRFDSKFMEQGDIIYWALVIILTLVLIQGVWKGSSSYHQDTFYY